MAYVGADLSLRVVVMGINYAPEPTGIAPYTAGMVAGLRRRGHDVHVVTTHPHYPEWRFAEASPPWVWREQVDGVPVTRLRHYVPARPVGLRRLASEVSFGARLARRVPRTADVLLLPSPALVSSAMAIEVARAFSRPPALGVVVQDLYSAGLDEARGAETFPARVVSRLERRVLDRADGVAVIHERFKRRVVQDLGVASEKIRVIRNWTHVPPAPIFDRVQFRRDRGWRADELIVLHTGAMGEKQDLLNVVEAARLADEGSWPVRFVLVGAGGQLPMVLSRARDVDRLIIEPPVTSEEYPRLLASADVLLVNERPGLAETAVPSKLTSYFSSGLPVLAATDASSTTADELAASEAGIRTEPGNPGALLSAVLKMSQDADWRRSMGERGPRYAEATTSERVALDGYDAFVRELASKERKESGWSRRR